LETSECLSNLQIITVDVFVLIKLSNSSSKILVYNEEVDAYSDTKIDIWN